MNYRQSNMQQVGGAPQYDLKQLFADYDSDGDGFLNVHELTEFYAATGQHVQQQDLQTHMKHLGCSNRGVSYQDFIRMVRLR